VAVVDPDAKLGDHRDREIAKLDANGASIELRPRPRSVNVAVAVAVKVNDNDNDNDFVNDGFYPNIGP
jgi:hypothetical protein